MNSIAHTETPLQASLCLLISCLGLLVPPLLFLNSWTFLDQIVLIKILYSLTACLHQHVILFLLILCESEVLNLPSSTALGDAAERLQFRSSYSQFSVVEFIKLNVHLRLILFQFSEIEDLTWHVLNLTPEVVHVVRLFDSFNIHGIGGVCKFSGQLL